MWNLVYLINLALILKSHVSTNSSPRTPIPNLYSDTGCSEALLYLQCLSYHHPRLQCRLPKGLTSLFSSSLPTGESPAPSPQLTHLTMSSLRGIKGWRDISTGRAWLHPSLLSLPAPSSSAALRAPSDHTPRPSSILNSCSLSGHHQWICAPLAR